MPKAIGCWKSGRLSSYSSLLTSPGMGKKCSVSNTGDSPPVAGNAPFAMMRATVSLGRGDVVEK